MDSGDNRNEIILRKFRALEAKWWFRLVKVAYVLLAIIALIIMVALFWDERPYQTVDNKKSYIQCDRDVASNLIYYLDKNGWNQWGQVYGDEVTLSYSDDQEIRKTCARPLDENTGKPKTSFWDDVFLDNQPLNYKFYPYLETKGSYGKWVRGAIICLAVFYLFYRLLIELFYYVVTGKRIFRKINNYEPN